MWPVRDYESTVAAKHSVMGEHNISEASGVDRYCVKDSVDLVYPMNRPGHMSLPLPTPHTVDTIVLVSSQGIYIGSVATQHSCNLSAAAKSFGVPLS